LDHIASPLFVEPKGFVFVGDSRRRMSMDNMPSHAEVLEFGRRVADELGMCLLREKSDSRVAVFGEDGTETKIPGLDQSG
jgi:tRNA wybutosine-synthesizing protein 1